MSGGIVIRLKRICTRPRDYILLLVSILIERSLPKLDNGKSFAKNIYFVLITIKREI